MSKDRIGYSHPDLQEVWTIGTSTQSKISHLLSLSLYRQALVLLFDMFVNHTPAKLGSLQRWVRDCDATSWPGRILTAEESEERDTVLKCLDMVLRVCGGAEQRLPKGVIESLGDDPRQVEGETTQAIRRMRVWNVRDEIKDGRLQEEVSLWPLVQQGFESEFFFDWKYALSLMPFTDPQKGTLPSFWPVQVTPGHLRRPPNVYDSTVQASHSPSPIPFPQCSQPTFSIPHPVIPSCSMILNVLSPKTCESIIESANTLGWEQDQAAGGSAVDKTSVLAHNVVWLADEDFERQLFERIKPFVQQTVVGPDGKGGKIRGINRRFRVYRYGPNQVYRVRASDFELTNGLTKV